MTADWQDEAACVGHDPELWFAHEGDARGRDAVDEALEICANCNVREQCEALAIANEYRDGIWGGLRERELRRKLRQ